MTPPDKKHATPIQPPMPVTTRWAYPFVLRDAALPDTMQSHFMAISPMDGGFFPLSTSGFSNGSLHFGQACKDTLKLDEGFRCMADGEVVAYRLDDTLHRLDYSADRSIFYSVGFVLVRHRLALPPLPSETEGAADDAPVDGRAPTPAVSSADGIFFSLYSYNRPLVEFPTDDDGFRLQSLPFWQGPRRYRVGMRARDSQIVPAPVCRPGDPAPEYQPPFAIAIAVPGRPAPPTPKIGLRVRAEGHKNAPVIGLLPRGSVLTVKGKANQTWAQIEKVRRVTPVAPVVGDPDPQEIEKGWVFLGELDYEVDPERGPPVVLTSPYPVRAGDLLGYLGQHPGANVAGPFMGARVKRPTVVIEVFAGDAFPAFLAESRRRAAALPDKAKTVLVIEPNAKLCRMPQLNIEAHGPDHLVVARDAASASGSFVRGPLYRVSTHPEGQVAAGDKLSGFRRSADGKQRITTAIFDGLDAGGKAAYPLVEVLSPVPGMDDCWGQASHQPHGHHKACVWSEPPLAAEHGRAFLGFQASLSRAELDALPDAKKFTGADGAQWWQVEVGTTHSQSANAWVCEKGMADVHWESPHAWPGFSVADGTTFEPLEALQRSACVLGDVHPEHEESFRPVAAALGHSELIVKLEEAIDAAGEHNGNVTASDIAYARQVPWLARGLSRLIVRFHSQWSDDLARWNKITPFMHPDWQTELRRQAHRGWWPDVAGKVEGFPKDPHVYHFHPFGWVDNFMSSVEASWESLMKELGSIISSGESDSYEAYNTGTKNVPDGKVGHSYPVAGPVKVTSRSIDEILATKSLDGTDKNRLFATGKYQTIHKTLDAAKESMKLSGTELYDASMQERVFREHLVPTAGKTRALYKFLRCGEGSVDAAQLAASQQWASIGVPYGIENKFGRVSNGTLSYYDEEGVNAADKKATAKLRAFLSHFSGSEK